ncbi:MAG: hypothetical protein EOO43_09395, partial [Flavobacterium sp.]
MQDLLSELRRNNIKVKLTDGDLSVRSLDGTVPEHLLHQIRTNRSALIKFLSFSDVNRNSAEIRSKSSPHAELLKIWQQILKKEVIGYDDVFFEIGGNSIKALLLIAAVNKKFNKRLLITDVFNFPTIGGFSHLLDKSSDGIDLIPKIAKGEYYDVSYAQRRLWILSQFAEGNIAYNMPGIFRMSGHLDLNAFRKACSSIIERHEILRTKFKVVQGELKQIILSADFLNFQLKFHEYTNLKLKDELINKHIKDNLSYAFDLEQPPLFQILLVKYRPDSYHLIFNLHHIIFDGWSFEVLLTELITFYNAFKKNSLKSETEILKPLNIQYKDYTCWLNGKVSGNQLAGQKKYWLNKLKDEIPVLKLPYDRPRPAIKTHKGNSISYVIEEPLLRELRAIKDENQVTMFMLVTSFVKILLHKYSGQDEIIIGTAVAGRHSHQLENQIGFYVNTLVLKTSLNVLQTFKEFLSGIKTTVLEAYANDVYPFDLLVDDLLLKRDLSRSPLFDVMLVLNSEINPGPKVEMEEIKIDKIKSISESSKYDLLFHVSEFKSTMELVIEYNEDLFDLDTITRLKSSLDCILNSVVINQFIALDEIDHMGIKESERIINQLSTSKFKSLPVKTVMDLFEERVIILPENSALVFEGMHFNYDQLNRKCNQLANFLNSIVPKGSYIAVLV